LLLKIISAPKNQNTIIIWVVIISKQLHHQEAKTTNFKKIKNRVDKNITAY
jgi:hypothetical protein